MSRTLISMLALGAALTVGTQRLYANEELIADEDSIIPCTDGAGPECARTTTSECKEWKTIEVTIGLTGGSARVCSTQTTTTSYYYIRYP